MKKLISIASLLLLTALSVVTASPLWFLMPAPTMASITLGISTDVAAISAYADEHKRDLISTLVNGLDIAKDIQVIPNVKNKIQLTKVKVGNAFRPFSHTHEPKTGHIVYSDRELSTKTGKIDLLLDSKSFKDKHLAWRTSPGNRASKTFNDMDFAPYVWNEVVMGLQREVNDETAYFGFDSTAVAAFNAATAYTVGQRVKFTVNSVTEFFECVQDTTAGQTPLTHATRWRNVTARAVVPGLKTYIDAAIAASFPVTATGAITNAATAQAALLKLFRDMPPAYKNWGVIIHASYTDYEFGLDALATRTQYVSASTQPFIGENAYILPESGGKCLVKAATWLGGSRRLIAEPMMPGTTMGMNLVMGTDLLSDANDIQTIPDVYSLKAGITLDLGFQIQDLDALRLGDQA